MNKKKIFILIGIFWIVIIGGFIGFKEFTLRTGSDVLLKTVPVDPRDLFRGDYVTLRYEISTIDLASFSSNDSEFNVGDRVYVLLGVDENKVGKAIGISKKVPSQETFMKGTVKSIYNHKLTIEYGIESYFIPEGKGNKMSGNGGKIFAKVAIDKAGNVIIKSLILDGKEFIFD